MLGHSTRRTLLAALYEILRDPAKLRKTRLCLFDIVDYTLQRGGVLIDDRIDDVPKFFGKSVTTLARRYTLRMVPTPLRATHSPDTGNG
jgi:hypothetical protein